MNDVLRHFDTHLLSILHRLQLLSRSFTHLNRFHPNIAFNNLFSKEALFSIPQ